MNWEDDLRALAAQRLEVPATPMVMRHWRAGSGGMTILAFLDGSMGPTELLVALYPLDAPVGCKPAVIFSGDSGGDMDDVAQQLAVTVFGWPTPGRAVVVEAAGLRVVARSPCHPAGFRAPRLEKG